MWKDKCKKYKMEDLTVDQLKEKKEDVLDDLMVTKVGLWEIEDDESKEGVSLKNKIDEKNEELSCINNFILEKDNTEPDYFFFDDDYYNEEDEEDEDTEDDDGNEEEEDSIFIDDDDN